LVVRGATGPLVRFNVLKINYSTPTPSVGIKHCSLNSKAGQVSELWMRMKTHCPVNFQQILQQKAHTIGLKKKTYIFGSTEVGPFI
jgi:hypothetical protein